MVSAGFEHGLKYYELDYFGHTFAVESGVVFHMGNRYVSYSRRKEKGIVGDTPCDVKRILVGNQIVLNLLMSNTQMQRFGIMETMRANDLEQAGEDCMIRTESLEHNMKIAEYLKENGMWREEDPILFTEDLLNMKRSRVSIYALGEDNTQSWYALPENKEFFRETA